MVMQPIAPDIFTLDSPPHLIGGRRKDDGRIVFPCPRGNETDLYEQVLLPNHGTLWSWTIQHFRPKTPPYLGVAEFEPFALGYVKLDEQVIVETRLVGMAFDDLVVGMPLALTLIPFETQQGESYLTYAFTIPEGNA